VGVWAVCGGSAKNHFNMRLPTIAALALAALATAAASSRVVSRSAGLAASARTFSPRVVTHADLDVGADGVVRGRRLASDGANPTLNSIVSVSDFGAVGDGVTDNTAAFAAAMGAVSTGGVIWVGSGLYSFDGSVVFAKGVSLVGTFETVPSHAVGQGGSPPINGSILMPRGGRGNESGPAFLQMAEDCTVRGFVVYYPEQLGNSTPVPYPWTIAMSGNNNAVVDVELLNVWNGIQAVGAARHYISRVQGQPANIGIFIDQIYDIGRVENVHWNPWCEWGENPTGEDGGVLFHTTHSPPHLVAFIPPPPPCSLGPPRLRGLADDAGSRLQDRPHRLGVLPQHIRLRNERESQQRLFGIPLLGSVEPPGRTSALHPLINAPLAPPFTPSSHCTGRLPICGLRRGLLQRELCRHRRGLLRQRLRAR
jgi:hypothetical protein